MSVKLNDTESLRIEFEGMQLGFNELHDTMQTYRDGYEHGFYYANRPNVTVNNRTGVNLIQLFLDKLWDHVSEFPKINVPTTPDDKQNGDLREKVLISEHQKNNTEGLWGHWTFDGSCMAAAAGEVTFDVKKRCNIIRRLDPRYCYWQRSDQNQEEITTFWHAVPMSRTAIRKKYGITPKGDGMVYNHIISGNHELDNEDYFLVITRHDSEHTVKWVGGDFIQKPFKHNQGVIPVELAFPVQIANFDTQPFFWLSKLKDLQAEFNEYWRRRANIVRKLGNPLVWGTGMYKQHEQQAKRVLQGDGGFLSLKENGSLNLLTIPETAMIDNTLNDLFQKMKDVAGFPTATFGESVGANTSGDALGMYFTPTQKMVNKHNKAWKTFLTGINARILRNYDMFGLVDEEFKLGGYMPHSSIRTTDDGQVTYGKSMPLGGTFTRDIIGGQYYSIVTPPSITPKDDIGYKQFILQAVSQKFISKTTGYDELGMLSPEDELKLLQQESNDVMLNPEGAKVALGQEGTTIADTGQVNAPSTDPMAQPLEV